MFERRQPLVSIVIPSWFTPTQHGKYGKNETFWFAFECLQRLENVTPGIHESGGVELIIIDNGSTLTAADYQFDPRNLSLYWNSADVLIRNKVNLGFAPACNQGFALARGEYVVCLNNDILVWPGWIKALIEPFNLELDPPCGVSMPALVKEVKDAHDAISLLNIDLTQNPGRFGMGAEFGSCWMTKKTILDELVAKDGFVFDEIYLGGFQEDRDLWKRIRIIGLETYRTHNTRVYHLGNLSMTKLENRKFYTEGNRKKFAEKWGDQHK